MKYLILIFLLPFMISCTSKEGYIEDYREFITDVRKDFRSYDDEKWKETDELFEEYSEKMYDKFFDDLSDDEICELNTYNSIYLGIKMSLDAREKLQKTKNK